MKRYKLYILSIVFFSFSCQEILEPEPVNLLIDELVLNEPRDVGSVEIGLYNAFRGMGAPIVVAGDFTADMILHNGTFNQYREFGNKEISSANGAIGSLWGSIYRTVYVANFIIENLPTLEGVNPSLAQQVLATAHFLRGFAYFTGAHTYGGIPLVINTDLEANRVIPRATKEEILALVLEDYQFAEGKLPVENINPGFASDGALNAAFARYYLYEENWQQAAEYATRVIDSEEYVLEQQYERIVNQDFTSEAILEVGYTINDDPGTSTLGLNNIFIGRREVIPSNQAVFSLNSTASGDREATLRFNSANLRGNDNGWTVIKYGTADEDNNNIVIFRLGEMYLIRAEARAQMGMVNGENSAQEDINVLRDRANAPSVNIVNRSQALEVIENERLYELAYEGHRWYDLVRTGRVDEVMPVFNSNWRSAFERWPIPLGEIQNNPALQGDQNPGY